MDETFSSSQPREPSATGALHTAPDYNPNGRFDWLTPSATSDVIGLVCAMADERAARAVFEKFPNLIVPDPHAAKIFCARKAALNTTDATLESFDNRTRNFLCLEVFAGDEIARECLQILSQTSSTKVRGVYSKALQEATRIYRRDHPIFPQTDAGNGERFAFHNFERIRFVAQWKKWLVWNGQFWERDETDAALNLAKETARKIPDEAKGATGEKYTAILKHAIASESASRLHAMLDLGRSESGITIRAGELDANQWLFNVANGTLDLKAASGTFRPHHSDDFLTKISPAFFDENATAPNWEKCLLQIFGGSEELARYFARVVGYSMTGDTREQILIVLHGSGSNGKSLLLRVLARLFGDFAHTMEPSTICAKYGDKMATDVAELFGKRFVVSSETNDGRRLDEGMVKRMTGGEYLTGERKFENAFTFEPQFQVFF